MSMVLSFPKQTRGRARDDRHALQKARRPVGTTGFWLEVCSFGFPEDRIDANRENSLGRVLFEAFLVLAGAAAMAVAASILVPVPV